MWTLIHCVNSVETEIIRIDGDDSEDATLTLSMSDVLFFACGAIVMPPIGFERQLSIDFHTKSLPEVNTCGPVLHLPISAVDYNILKDAMVTAIVNTPYFDLP